VSESPFQRVAAVDIGSNTVHLIIADLDRHRKTLKIVERQVDLARLGADVVATGAIGAERAARVEATLRTMASLAAQHGANPRIALATEGVRAASNASAMLARFGAAWGSPIALVTGLEEAALTFWGATSVATDPLARLAVADLGGGSTEITIGDDGTIVRANSFALGSGKLMAEVNPSDPMTQDELSMLREHARTTIAAAVGAGPDEPLAQLIAVGGTANSIVPLLNSNPQITKPTMLARHENLTRGNLESALLMLCSFPRARLVEWSGMDVERVKILPAGIAAWDEILRWSGRDALTVSQRGVREGALIAYAHAGNDWQAYAHAATAKQAPGK